MRRLLSLLAIVAMLALPASTLAAGVSQTTTVPETLAAYDIAMTVPATGTYAQVPGSPGFYQYQLNVTAVSTNSPSGLTVKTSVSTLTGPATIPTTDRQLAATTGLSAGLTATAPASTAYGAYANATTQITTVTSAGPVSAGTFILWPTVRNITVSGTYTGSITLIATSN